MLNLPVSTSALLASGDPLAPVFLLEIEWPDAARTYPDRDCALDGAPLPARLWSVERWRAEACDPSRPRLPRFEATVRLANLDANNLERFENRAAEFQSLGRPARLMMGFAASGSSTVNASISFASADLATLSPLVLRSWRREGAEVVLELADPVTAEGARQAAIAFEPSAGSAYPFERLPNRRIPWVFGRVEGLALSPWRFGPVGTLAADLLPSDAFAAIESVQNFPESGSVQIGAEIMDYAEVGAFANRLGSPGEPLARSNPMFHRAGEAVYCVPAGGFAWVVAAHECESVSNVRHSGGAVDSSDYMIGTALGNGRTLTIVEAGALPTSEGGSSGPRTLRVDAQDVGASWSEGAFNDAGNPEGALACDDISQYATISPSQPLLEIQCAALPFASPAFGPIEKAKIVVEYAASVAWASGSVLTLGATNGSDAIVREIPRPPSAERTAKMGASTIDLPVNLRRFSFDATEFFGEGWERLQSPHSLFVNLAAVGGETAEIQVTALFWEVSADRPPRMVPRTDLSADILGWTAGGASMVERPSRLAEAILARPEAMGLDPALLDGSNLAALDAEEAAAGLRIARVADGAERWETLLAELLAQAGLDLKARGPDWRLERASPAPSLENPVASLSQDDFFATPEPKRDSPPPPEERFADWIVFHGERMGAPGYERAAKASLGLSGADAKTFAAEWLPNDQGSAASMLAGRLLDIGSRAGEIKSVQAGWPSLALAWAGDVASLGLDPALPGTPALIRSIQGGSKDRDGFVLEAELLAPGAACWSDGERAVLQHAGRAFHFVIVGACVAILRADGTLLLRGKASEGQTLPATSAAVEWNAAQSLLVFSAMDGATATPVFALDASGNLQLAGALATGSTLATGAECLLSEGGALFLSLSDERGLLEANALDLKVNIAGGLREFCLI